MNSEDITVEIQPAAKPGTLKAFAVVKIDFPNGELVLHGFSVIEQVGKPTWVGFPQKMGKTPGRYFPVTEAYGELRGEIAAAVLDAYNAMV